MLRGAQDSIQSQGARMVRTTLLQCLLVRCFVVKFALQFVLSLIESLVVGSWLVILLLVFLASLLQMYCGRSTLSHAVLVVIHFCLVTLLSPQQFRDALSLRYHRSLMLMPPTCDGCGAAFTLSHALDCWKGGLVVRRHNEIHDALADLACLAYKDVI